MNERRNAAPGLIDGLTADLGGPRTNALLERLDAAVPWEELARPIRRLYKGNGRAAWPVVTMLKAMLLAKWFNLSDPQLEECLQDRLSFRRFVGLSLTDRTPDETTFVVFRRRLRQGGIQDELFETVLKHIEGQGLLVREGTLVDATIIEAPRGQKGAPEKRDQDATFTRKCGEVRFGYKAHIAVDRSGVVTDYRLSTAKHHDSRYIDEMTAAETKGVFADSAYMDRRRTRQLVERGVVPGITFRGTSKRPELSEWQKRWNAMLCGIRAKVEHPFAMMKHNLGYRRVRYRGHDRNRLDLCLTLMACNIKRSLSLHPT